MSITDSHQGLAAQTCDRRSKITFCRPHSLFFEPVLCMFLRLQPRACQIAGGWLLYTYIISNYRHIAQLPVKNIRVSHTYGFPDKYGSYGYFTKIPWLNLPGARCGNTWVASKSPNSSIAYFGVASLALYASTLNHCLGLIVGLPNPCACYLMFCSIG